MTLVALAVYLLPFAVAFLARGSRDPRPAELALDIPMVFALDALGVLVLTLVLPLDWAALASRVVWIAIGATLAWKRRLAWPRCLNLRAASLMALGAAVGSAVSLRLSRDYMIWDRRWHMPLVAAMGGQRLPFHNVYEPGAVLHYHFTGDVHAAMLRAFSSSHMSSALALSLSHDVIFALMGALVGLLFARRPGSGAWLVVFATAAILLHGPVVQKDASGWDFRAHMYQTFLTDSFRPHVAVSALLLTGMVATACVRATEGVPRQRQVAAAMLACAALLSISDESSFCIVIASLGVAWLVEGKLLADRRWTGLALLAGMGASGVAANLVFSASLAPGGPVQRVEIVPARVSDLFHGATPLWSEAGLRNFGYDLFPLVAPTLGVLFYAVSRRSRRMIALAALPCVATVVSAILATKIRINGIDGVECQRFFVAVFFVVLVVSLWLLPSMGRWSISSGLVGVGAALPVFFTVWWLREHAPEILRGSEVLRPPVAVDQYAVDCQRAAGARFDERPVATYVDEPNWYLYTTCRAVYEGGFSDPPWTTKIRSAFETPQHLAEFSKLVQPDAVAPAMCSKAAKENDRVCKELKQVEQCAPSGELFVKCPFPADVRKRLLGS
jgi:hypothetical protein